VAIGTSEIQVVKEVRRGEGEDELGVLECNATPKD